MKIRTKQLSALAMLPIVFILISFTTVQKTEPQASGKPVINISQASVFTVRDHSENAPLNPVRYPDFIVTNWPLAAKKLTRRRFIFGGAASENLRATAPASLR